jgi:hypothetical protein
VIIKTRPRRTHPPFLLAPYSTHATKKVQNMVNQDCCAQFQPKVRLQSGKPLAAFEKNRFESSTLLLSSRFDTMCNQLYNVSRSSRVRCGQQTQMTFCLRPTAKLSAEGLESTFFKPIRLSNDGRRHGRARTVRVIGGLDSSDIFCNSDYKHFLA